MVAWCEEEGFKSSLRGLAPPEARAPIHAREIREVNGMRPAGRERPAYPRRSRVNPAARPLAPLCSPLAAGLGGVGRSFTAGRSCARCLDPLRGPRNECREKAGKCQHCRHSQPLPAILWVQGRSKAAISAAKIHRAAVTRGCGATHIADNLTPPGWTGLGLPPPVHRTSPWSRRSLRVTRTITTPFGCGPSAIAFPPLIRARIMKSSPCTT
jgi:hypothetical protein